VLVGELNFKLSETRILFLKDYDWKKTEKLLKNIF